MISKGFDSGDLPWTAVGAVVLSGMLGYLLVVKTFWFHDDWYFLANAAGMADLEKGGSRWVSYQGYWKLFYPLFGLNTFAWALTRLLLQGIGTWLVMRIARLLSFKPSAAIVAGLLFAASPVAFECLYWGTGVVEILGAVFVLAAMDQWLRATRMNYGLALLWGILAVGSKEIGFFLPLFFAAHLLWLRKKEIMPWVVVLLLLGATVGAGLLLSSNLHGDQGYSLSLASIPRNLMILGFWLVAPATLQTGNEVSLSWPLVVGALIWATWLGLAVWNWRKKKKLPLLTLVICILAMGPALPLTTHILPRYNYGPMAAAALGLAFLLSRILPVLKIRWVAPAAVLVVLLTAWNTHHHLHAEYDNGRIVHRLVVKEEISRLMCQRFKAMEWQDNDRLVFYLEPFRDKEESQYLYESLGGSLGLQLVLDQGILVEWVKNLEPAHQGGFVVSVRGFEMEPMGRYRPVGDR